MKRVFVVVAVVMALTLVLGATSVGAQSPMWGPWYQVRYGDTLSGIGQMYGVSYWEIARANGIWNPNLIYAGQALYVPPARPWPQPYPGGYGQQWPGYGGYGGGYGGGYASWSSGGYMSWGGYPYGGGYYPYPMPYGGGMMPYGGGNNGGGWGTAMPMGASF